MSAHGNLKHGKHAKLVVNVQLTTPEDIIVLCSPEQVQALLAVNHAIHGHGTLSVEHRRLYAAFAKSIGAELSGATHLVRGSEAEVVG